MTQILTLTGASLRDLPRRVGNSLVIVVGMAGVVVVLVPVLAMYLSLRATLEADGRPDRAVVLARDASSEYESALSRETIAAIENAPGVRRNQGGAPLVSAEVVLAAPVSRLRDHSDVNVTLRGVGREYFTVRPELKLVAGRMFRPGTQELLVGSAALTQFEGLKIGNVVRLEDGDWTVVGVIAGGQGARDSELIADAQTVMSAYKLQSFNSMVIALQSPEAVALLRNALMRDTNFTVTVYAEPQILATEASSDPVSRMLRLVTYTIGSIMALGAIFAALNSTYSSIVKRAAEMATVRAIGFSGAVIATAILAEALLLALVGAAIGAAIAYCAFNGATISTLGGAVNDSQLVYSLSIAPQLLAGAIALACLLGLAGAVPPAIRAARANIPLMLLES